jgi:hypothetical protein
MKTQLVQNSVQNMYLKKRSKHYEKVQSTRKG